jgi:hypothetical protein
VTVQAAAALVCLMAQEAASKNFGSSMLCGILCC